MALPRGSAQFRGNQTQDREGSCVWAGSRLAIHVVEGAAAPANEITPLRIHVVAGAIVETGPEIGLGATAGFTGVSAFLVSCPTLATGFLASFFVSHGV